jgi:large subunit ribosomal protein L9
MYSLTYENNYIRTPMNIILLEKIQNLGNIGDVVKVASGYGRNFLIPQGKATIASTENLKVYEAKKEELLKREADEVALSQDRKDKVNDQIFEIKSPCGPEGKLFGSVGLMDIAEACSAKGFEVLKSEVRLPDGPLKELGEYAIELHFNTEVSATIKVIILAEEA